MGEKWRIHSGNKIIERTTQSEAKIQLTMVINFISSKDSDETRTMRTKIDNIAVMIKLLKSFLNLFCKDIKKY